MARKQEFLGYDGNCKICKAKISGRKKFCKSCLGKRHYWRNKREYQRKYYKQWYAKSGRKRNPNYMEITKKWAMTHKEERAASLFLRMAIGADKIRKPEYCENCKAETFLHGHHENYKKPLEVMWLCASCHKQKHWDKRRALDKNKRKA